MKNKSKLLKLSIIPIILIILSNIVLGVVVIENPNLNPEPEKEGGIGSAISGAIFMGLLLGLAVGVVIFVIYWIIKKIKENQRKHTDLLYSRFLIELKNSHQNRDTELKKRNIFTFGLTYARTDIYLNTKEKGIKYFGKYDGELLVKDNFYLIAVHRITGMFSREKDIIIIPYELRNKVRKEKINGKSMLLIEGESVDECLNTDFYNEIIFQDEKTKDKLISFNDYISTHYLQNYVYRQIIKDNLLDYKESLDKIVEMNPYIQTERKNPKG
jgi:hypothetical protein